MYTVENKFEIGEECYSVHRVPVQYKCPICEGKGNFEHNGHNIWCRNCNGTGKLHDAKICILEVCKVEITRIIASIIKNGITVKYKVRSVDDIYCNIRNRSECTLFKTKEEADNYCVGVNTKQITSEF